MHWEKEFEIGCEMVDAQHRELVNLVSEFEKSIEKSVTGKQLADVLRFVVGYTRYHFSAEEQLMQQIGYNELIPHKKIHDELIHEVTGILLKLKNGEKLEPARLLEFLTDWVKKHVLEEDKKIGEFFRSRQKETPVCALNQVKETIYEKLQKLKELFLKKLINIEDYRQQKIKILIEGFNVAGLTRVRAFYGIVNQFIASDILSLKDLDLFTQEVFEKHNLRNELAKISDIEGKLFLIRIFVEYELTTEEEVNDVKAQILSEL